MQIGSRTFDIAHGPYIMGILNVTPDSFSDGGRYVSLDAALAQVERMIAEGADVIDIGGESTRPGAELVPEAEEMERVMPVIEAVRARFDIPLSLDTYKSAVVREGLARGVDLVNDVWGLLADPEMGPVIAESGAACCLMHNRREPVGEHFETVWPEEMAAILDRADAAGIDRSRVILDPGVGFGKTYEQNLYVIGHLDVVTALGCPVLLGTSRKSVIGNTLGTPPDERALGTAVTTVFAALAGCMLVRVHDVRENQEAIRMARAIREETI